MAARAPPSVAPPCQRNPGKDLLGKSVKQNTKLQKKNIYLYTARTTESFMLFADE